MPQFFNEGERTWNLQNPAVLHYLDQLEADLRAGHFEAIGELYANNRITGGGSQFPADAPLMQRLWALSATYQVPLSMHTDATDESVGAMERLLASDRRGIWIWAHAGTYADTPLLWRLLQAHPNLYCELSARVPTGLPGGPPRGLLPLRDQVSIHGQDERLRPVWVELLEAFPDRFVIGTDAAQRTPSTDADIIGIWRQILMQLAHRNAERLMGLSP